MTQGVAADPEVYEETARVYRQAYAEGRPPRAAVADHFRISLDTAAKRVSRARERGLLPPTSQGRGRATEGQAWAGWTARSRRDLRPIRVTVHQTNLGSGTPEEGGGELGGGLVLLNRVTVDVSDPVVPDHRITITVAASEGRIVCESLTVSRVGTGPIVTATVMRKVPVDAYLLRAREELVTGTTYISRGQAASCRGVGPEEIGDRRGGVPLSRVAALYRDALADPSPRTHRAPTAAVAGWLDISRGHASRLVSQARREGLLGAASHGQAGEAS